MKNKKLNLLELQQDFAKHLFDDKKIKVADLVPYSKQEALARLNVYRNNVFGNFSAVLESIFKVTRKILGDKKFADFVDEYIKSYPSKSGNLDEYGEFFAEFLAKNIKKHKIDFLADLATIELAHYQSFFVEALENNFDLKGFKKIKAEDFLNLRFEIHHSMKLFSSKFPICSIWHKEKKISAKNGEFVLVANGSKPTIEMLCEAEFLFLIEADKGEKLYRAYEKICKKTGEKFDVGKAVNRFVASGVIVGFEVL